MTEKTTAAMKMATKVALKTAAVLALIITSPATLHAADEFPTSISQEQADRLPIEELERIYLQDRCGNKCADELLFVRENDPLTLAEQFVLQKYTEQNSVENLRIMVAGLTKIAPSKVKVFHGGSMATYNISARKQVITLEGITSTSTDREISEGFVKDLLMVIKAKSARSVQSYSVVWEKEYILLPGTRLVVDDIKTVTLRLGEPGARTRRQVQLVELTEL